MNKDKVAESLCEFILIMAIVWLVSLALTGCGRDDRRHTTFSSMSTYSFEVKDSRLGEEVDDFLDAVDQKGLIRINTPLPRAIEYASLPEGILGYCTGLEGRVQITDKARYWTYNQVRTLVWHEMGHCMYDMDHDPVPGRIMSATVNNQGDFKDRAVREQEFLKDLRDRSPLLKD